jgi:hypothetical protein
MSWYAWQTPSMVRAAPLITLVDFKDDASDDFFGVKNNLVFFVDSEVEEPLDDFAGLL